VSAGCDDVETDTILDIADWYPNDSKKAEQASARDHIKKARNAGVDVDGGQGEMRGKVQVN
jgi:hypothetical protein